MTIDKKKGIRTTKKTIIKKDKTETKIETKVPIIQENNIVDEVAILKKEENRIDVLLKQFNVRKEELLLTLELISSVSPNNDRHLELYKNKNMIKKLKAVIFELLNS